MKEYIFEFRPLTSLDDYVITTVVAENLEEAENKAKEKVEGKGAGDIYSIYQIKDGERTRLI